MTTVPILLVESFQTGDSSKSGYAVINESTGSIAIDYTLHYERIATALETIATKMSSIEALATGTGIHVSGAYDWLGLMSVYKLYVEDDGAIGLENLKYYKY